MTSAQENISKPTLADELTHKWGWFVALGIQAPIGGRADRTCEFDNAC